MFLDSASLKVCDFTVLTHHVPMHLSFPICPLLHIVCLREQPDISTGLAISHVSVGGGTVSQKLLGKQKDQQLSKVLLSLPNLDPPLSTHGFQILCHDLLHCRPRNVFCPWLGSWEHSVHPEHHFSWMMAFPFYPSDLVQLHLSVHREVVSR